MKNILVSLALITSVSAFAVKSNPASPIKMRSFVGLPTTPSPKRQTREKRRLKLEKRRIKQCLFGDAAKLAKARAERDENR